MGPRSVLESYLLEIVARARSAQERCSHILSYDFFSDSPPSLARAISLVCGYLSQAAVSIFAGIEWDDPDQLEQDIWLLRNTDNLIQQLAAHLRYVQGARSDRLPWGIIPSFERLVHQLVPEKQVMLRPKWNYNYSVTLSDFRSSYLTALEEFADYVPGVDIRAELAQVLKHPFHIIAFPALERENILLHTLLGHELGHLFAQRFLTERRKTEFKESVIAQVEVITDSEMRREGYSEAKSGFLFPEFKRKRIARNASLALEYWTRALEELLSDVVGAILFGPAALFSTLDMAMQQGYDIPPSPETRFYPPWRMRLREVFRIVNADGVRFFPISDSIFSSTDASDRAKRVNEQYRFIEGICKEKSDSGVLSAHPLARIAYDKVEKSVQEGTDFLLKECKLTKHRSVGSSLYKHINFLIDRLDHDIPPNALERNINDKKKQVTLVEIINAAWLHRASIAAEVLDESGMLSSHVTAQRKRANKLTLKAIELAGLASGYWKENKIASYSPDPSGGDSNDHSGEVLSASEIVGCMERQSLDERLIITPLLNPAESIGSGSLDVRLGNQFIIMKREAFPLLDIADPEADGHRIERYQERLIKGYGEKFILHPRQLVIGSTLEYIQIPPGLMCYVIGKSTWGRMGLIIATATKVDPGYRGCITLEIINEGEIPLVLYPGVPIAQLVLHRASGSSRYEGGYSCAIGPEFPKFGGKREAWAYWTRPRR